MSGAAEATTGDAPATTGPVVACVKWVDLRPEIDPVHGTVTPSAHGWGISPADRAAVEVALRLAEARGTTAVVLSAAPADADSALVGLASCGTHGVVRIDQAPDTPSDVTAETLAAVLGPGDLHASAVVCGDLSYDRGSGSVPSLIAYHLDIVSALGIVEIDMPAAPDAPVTAVRRLDGARRERLAIGLPAVMSVEGAVAELRRAPLSASISRRAAGAAAGAADVHVRAGRPAHHVEAPRTRPLRPRARVLAPPAGESALDRVLQLTDAAGDHAPPRTVEAEPAEAAELILDQLREWGYLDSESGS